MSEKEIKQLQKRFAELAAKSFSQNIYTYTGFLSISDQAVFYEMEKQLAYAGYELFGGNLESERKMLRFGNQNSFGYTEEFPITLLMVKPLLLKFADDLTHRDFLGAMMNLGIERSTIGDILIQKQVGYVYCQDKIADYLIENLSKIKHTNVSCKIADREEVPSPPKPEPLQVTVASARIDAVIAKVYHLSRAQSIELFRAGKVFLNGRMREDNSCYLKAEDAVTVRGFGKFIYQGNEWETKKGKLGVTVLLYGNTH